MEMISLAMVLAVIGILAFVINIITELTKGLGFLAKIPTVLQVMVEALILCLLLYFGYCSYIGISILWYHVTSVIVASFIVSYVALYGWEKLFELYNRFKKEGK